MTTIKGRQAVIAENEMALPGEGRWFIHDAKQGPPGEEVHCIDGHPVKYRGPVYRYLNHQGEWENTAFYWPTRAAAESFLTQHADQPPILERIAETADALPEEAIAGIPTDGAS